MVAKMKGYTNVQNKRPRFKIEMVKPPQPKSSEKSKNLNKISPSSQDPYKMIEELKQKLQEQGILLQLLYRENK